MLSGRLKITLPRNDNRLSVASSSALLLGLIFYYFPSLLYRGNSDFIDSSFVQMGAVTLPIYLLFVAILWIIGKTIKGPWSQFYPAALGSLAFLGLIIGNFLFFNRGLLDGRESLKADSLVYQIAELVGLSFTFIAFLVASLRYPKVIKNIILFFNMVMLGLVLITLLSDKKPYSFKKSNKALDSFYNLSSKKNVLIFLFDTFQSDVFNEILQEKPEFENVLDGFTFFSEATGVAPTTYLSLPAIHSGIEYSPGTPLATYYRETVVKRSFMSKLATEGYDSFLANAIGGCPAGVPCFSSTEIMEGVLPSSLKDALLFIDLSIYRVVPSFFKQSVYNNGNWLTVDTFFHYNRAVENNLFLKEIAKRISVETEKPRLRFIHSFSTHPPAGVDEDCNPVENVRWTRNSARDQYTCTLRLFGTILNRLKESGAYDNSLIIVMADHGYGFKGEIKPTVLQAANPVLLIKPFTRRGQLKMSQKSVFLTDLPRTVCELTKDCEISFGLSPFEVNRPKERSIVFNDYKWQHEYWRTQSVPIRNRYVVRGPVNNVLSWYKEIKPHGVRSTHLNFSSSDSPEAFGLGWWGYEVGKAGTIRWTNGPYAQVYMPLDPKHDSRVEMLLINHRSIKNQSLKFYVNDVLIGQTVLKGGRKETITFDIPAGVASLPVSRFTFKFSKFTTRAKGRNLAVAFDELRVLKKVQMGTLSEKR